MKAGQFLSGRVARRVFLMFVLSAFVPLAALAVMSLSQIRDLLIQQGDNRLAANAKSYGMAVFERLLLAQDVAAAALYGPQDSPPRGSLARRTFVSLGRIAADGQVLSTLGKPELPALSPDALDRLGQGKAVVVVGKDGAVSRVTLVVALGSGDSRATVVGDIAPDFLWGSVDLYPVATSFCIFEDLSRIVLFCPMQDGAASALAVDTPRTQSVLKSARWTRDGETHRAVTWGQFMRAAFGTADWVFVASQPEGFLLAPVGEFRRIFVPAMLLALLLVTWLTIRQARSILLPVERLANRARAIAKSDFDSRLDMKRDDEFGELAGAFDLMSSKLGRQFAALTALSEIDRLILSTVDTEQVVRKVIERMGQVVPADAVSVTLFDHENAALARVYFRGPAASQGLSITRLDMRPTERSALEADRQGAWLELAAPAPGHLAHLLAAGMRTAFIQPIVWRDAVCGALVLGYRAAASRNDEEQKQAREFADRVAVAVSSAWRDEQLYLQAHYDTLTGLPNRLLFKDRLGQEIIRCRREESRFAVLFIDLDRFKDVNDTFGHSAGDSVLREAAARIEQCVRGSDTVSRLGGDEFTVLLTHIQRAQDAGRIAENVVRALSRTFDIGEQHSFLGASVGIAAYPADGTTAEDLLKNADTAMYRAKAGGRSQAVYFEERMNAEAVARLTLDRDLRQAIERNELVLHYQPQLDLGTGAIRAAEALVRWQHPERGLILPGRFIGIAEESGFIEQIGNWVIRETCAQVRTWQSDGVELEHVAVNVSPRQFRRAGFADMIRGCVEEAGIDFTSLELEITEGLLVENAAAVEGMLRELNAMGIAIALDDFGTGFSSMSYLQRFPVDTIKIDRAFVEGLGRSADSQAIVTAVIAMSHALGKRVIAEGVETAEQAAILTKLECDEIQGYYLSPALPAAQFAQFLKSRALAPA
ncbi:MAG: EAL domain-containing protein [Betaproteobacteria bacterium]|nr:EAL domain-containing protein [Betaproteobacteria bacterium]